MKNKDLFTKCIEIVLLHEGGYQNNPDDLGNWVGGYKTGELRGTKYGIAARYFPEEDIKNLTKDRARELYFEHYWKPLNLDGILNHELVLQIFDFGVNAGTGRAALAVQRIVGVNLDGVIGPITTEAINFYKGDIVNEYIQERKDYYRTIAGLRNNKLFLKGWLSRVDNCNFKNPTT